MFHFISGLPRSGSTLLAALLRQNPRFHASITSPVGAIFNAVQAAVSQRNEAALFIRPLQRKWLLADCFMAYYFDTPNPVVFDTNRMWTTKLPALIELFPDAKMLCCVRNLAAILDSVERQLMRNPLELSAIFNFSAEGTVYDRAEALMRPTGLVGFAYNALREACFGPYRDRLLIVPYEGLTRHPLDTMAQIYNFLGEPRYDNNVENVAPIPEAAEFDARLGMPGLHEVLPRVMVLHERPVIPGDLWDRYANALDLPGNVRFTCAPPATQSE